MRQRIAVIGVLVLAVGVLAAMAPVASAGLSRNTYLTVLTGEQEPAGGDEDGAGAALVQLRNRNRVCFWIVVRRIGRANMGHIHSGRAGVDGAIVVPLFEGAVPRRTRCVRTTRRIWRQIRRNPRAFYVNVHTSDFPGGAVRGQLR